MQFKKKNPRFKSIGILLLYDIAIGNYIKIFPVENHPKAEHTRETLHPRHKLIILSGILSV